MNENETSAAPVAEVATKRVPVPYVMPTMIVCAVHSGDALPVTNEDGSTNFSILQNGRLSTTCKPCRALAANDWTNKRKDYRKVFHIALRAKNSGLSVIMPTAKSWKVGDVTMLTDGRTLDSVLAEQKVERDAKRQESSNLRTVALAATKSAKAEVRAAKKLEREQIAATAAEAKSLAKSERENTRITKQANIAAEKAINAELKATAKAEKVVNQQAKREAKLAESLLVKEQKASARAAVQATKLAERDQVKANRLAERQAKAEIKLAEKQAKAQAKAAASSQSEALTTSEAIETLEEIQESPIAASAVEPTGVTSGLKSFFKGLVS